MGGIIEPTASAVGRLSQTEEPRSRGPQSAPVLRALGWRRGDTSVLKRALQDLGQVVIAIVAIGQAQVLRRDPDSLVGKQQVKRTVDLAHAGEQGRGARGEELHPEEQQMQLQLDGARSVAEFAAAPDQLQAV